jgi:hypothetical protein
MATQEDPVAIARKFNDAFAGRMSEPASIEEPR